MYFKHETLVVQCCVLLSATRTRAIISLSSFSKISTWGCWWDLPLLWTCIFQDLQDWCIQCHGRWIFTLVFCLSEHRCDAQFLLPVPQLHDDVLLVPDAGASGSLDCAWKLDTIDVFRAYWRNAYWEILSGIILIPVRNSTYEMRWALSGTSCNC